MSDPALKRVVVVRSRAAADDSGAFLPGQFGRLRDLPHSLAALTRTLRCDFSHSRDNRRVAPAGAHRGDLPYAIAFVENWNCGVRVHACGVKHPMSPMPERKPTARATAAAATRARRLILRRKRRIRHAPWTAEMGRTTQEAMPFSPSTHPPRIFRRTPMFHRPFPMRTQSLRPT